MNTFIDAILWIFSPDRLSGSLPLPLAIWQHVAFTFGSVAIAAVIAIPLGWLIGHTGRGREVAVALSGAARALPSLGLVLLLVLLVGVVHKTEAAITSFVLLAIPSVLAGAYAGFEAIELRRSDLPMPMGTLDQAVDLTMALGPAGEVLRLWGDRAEEVRPKIAGEIREALKQYETGGGVEAPASTWIISAVAPSWGRV